MIVRQAQFICSSTGSATSIPKDVKPEFAVIGRSNVGKSSLVNLLTGRKHLAKISATPGKTQTINYFLINNSWYLVDLPGYGYARVSKEKKKTFSKIITAYMANSRNLYCLFVLLDSRLDPQPVDLHFIAWAGKAGVPLALVFTKSDKVTKSKMEQSLNTYKAKLLEEWEFLPPIFITSSVKGTGDVEILKFIAEAMKRTI